MIWIIKKIKQITTFLPRKDTWISSISAQWPAKFIHNRFPKHKLHFKNPKLSQYLRNSPMFLSILIASVVLAYDLYYVMEKYQPILKLSKDNFQQLKIIKIQKLSHDTNLIRLKVDGTDVDACSHIEIIDDSCQIAREYTPITATTEYIDLVVKKCENGRVSNLCHSSKVGNHLLIRGPITTLTYAPNVTKDIVMICGGTGITPMYQLIKKVLSNPDDNTKLHLFYANKTEKDILLYRELAILANSNPHKFQLHLSVDTPQEDWKGSSGLISPSTFGEIPRTEVGILVCGSDGFINAVAGKKELRGQGPLGGILGLLGYQPSQVYKF